MMIAIPVHMKSRYLDASHLIDPTWEVLYDARNEYCHVIVAKCSNCSQLHVASNGLCWEHKFTLDPKDFGSVLELANAISQSMAFQYTKDVAAERSGRCGYEPTIN